MRKLNTSDVFAFCRIVKATDAREQLRVIVASAAKQKEAYKAAKAEAEAARAAGKKAKDPAQVDVTQVGVDGVLAIIEAAVEPRAEALVYRFLAGPLECSPDDVAAMPLDELVPVLRELARENNLTTFFNSVSGILGKG